MPTYQFDFSVVTEGETEDDALDEAIQLLGDWRFARETATVILLSHLPAAYGATDMAEDYAVLSDLDKHRAWLKWPEDRTPDEQDAAEEYEGARVRYFGE